MFTRKAFLAVLLAMPAIMPLLAADKTATLAVTVGTKYQFIDGFGGTGMDGQWYDVYTQQKAELLWGTGDGQVGLNIMRIRISPNEGEWGSYSNPVKWARRVHPGMQVFATPWTPPKKYKTQNTTGYWNDFGTYVWPLYEHPWGGQGSNGGAINPDCYEDYADFLERYRASMEAKGSPIDIISIQNESDYTPTTTDDSGEHASYESCIYSPTEMAAMCKALRQKLDSKCKVMGPECFGYGQENYNKKLMDMKDAQDYIDVWGNHLYGSYDWSYIKTVTSKTKKPMWMTEYYVSYGNFQGYSGQFAAEYEMVENLEKSMTSGYNGYVYYNMLDDFFAKNHGGSDTQLWKRAWVFSHYAKYATGKTRVASSLSGTSNVLKGGSSYVSQTGDSITVMVLNTSATDTYKLTVSLPFVPARIIQVATSDVANALRRDVTERYGNGTKTPVVTLLPGTFYTFQFERNAVTEEEYTGPAATPKQPEWGNPLSAHQFMADPTSVEYDGRLYVYATDDQQEFDYNMGMQTNSYAHITQLRCMSTADLVNWTDHGVIDVKAVAPWIHTSWAPSIVSREESDGKTHFYLYFTNTAAGIGVLTATSPTGPWSDPLGHALIDGNTPGLGALSNIIDPGVCMKNSDEAYLTFGGGDVTGTELQPGNARIVKLGSDMISLASDIKKIDAPCHFEANELNYINNKWYFTYCTRWSIVSEDEWKEYSKKSIPTAASIAYMTATDPLNGPWTYQGCFLPNPGTLGYPYGNNHSHIQSFKSKNYVLYHTQWLENQMGFSGGYRNLQITPVTINKLTSAITKLTASTANIEGVSQLSSVRVNPYEEQDGKMAAIVTGNWWLVRGVDFTAQSSPARSLILRVRGTGTLEVRPATVSGKTIATAAFTATGDEQTVVVPLSETQSAAVEYLYFVLTHDEGAQVLSWKFSTLTPEEMATGIESAASPHRQQPDAIFDLQGRHIGGRPVRGVYLLPNGKKVIY